MMECTFPKAKFNAKSPKINRGTLIIMDEYALIIYQNMSQGPTISSSDVLSLFQLKILAAINYIRNVNKQHPDAEAIYKYIAWNYMA